MFEGRNILVTGGAGFVGSNLLKLLLDHGPFLRATFHSKDPVIENKRIEYLQADLETPEDCRRVCQDMEYVFLCAAVTSGAAVMEKMPLVHLTPNLIMNARMLEAAYAAGVKKVLFISSNVVYPAVDYPVKEEDVTLEFFEKYFIAGWMKRFSEIVCEMYSSKIKTPMTTIVVRPGNIYGPLEKFDWETSHVLPALIRRVVERHDPIRVWGDGQDIKDFIFVEDFVQGLILAMEKIESFDVVNIASGHQYKLSDLLDLIIKLDGFQGAKVEYDPTKPTMIPKRLINPAKAKRLLGFEASTAIEVGLKKTIDWYRRTL